MRFGTFLLVRIKLHLFYRAIGGPAGGIWMGDGIVDASTGLYDPSILGDGFNDTLSYDFDGCVDERIVYIRYTTLDVNGTLQFCTDDDAFELTRETVGMVPRNGTWSGMGIGQQGDDWYFRPQVAGPGRHTLVYEANTCVDSIVVEVFQSPQIQTAQNEPLSICELEGPIAPASRHSGRYLVRSRNYR